MSHDMNSEELYSELMKYFPKNLDLMRHLNIHACWEYIITEKSTHEKSLNYISIYIRKMTLL